MEDIKELCDRVVIINLGSIVYDGRLDSLIEKHNPYKLLKVTFSNDGVVRNQVERFGIVDEFDEYHCVIKVPRKEAKIRASALLSSDLPVDDILIDEVGIDEVIREMFEN